MEEDRVRDSLNELLQAASTPNPLEVLGISKELAQELGPEALLIATKGLYRAHQLQLHPDRTTTEKAVSARADKLQRIQDAYDEITPESVDDLRKQLVKPKKRDSKRPASKEQTALQQLTKSQERLLPAIRKRALEFIDAVQSPESVFRIDRAHILVRPFSVLPQDSSLPLLDISMCGDESVARKLQIIDTTEATEEDMEILLPDELVQAIRVTESQTLVERPSGLLEINGTTRSPGWYIARGLGNKRSVQFLEPTERTEELSGQIVGTISQEAARSAMNSFFASSSQAAYERDVLMAGPQKSRVPSKFAGRFRIEKGWEKYTIGDKPDQILDPTIQKDGVLVSRDGDDLLILGRVEHTAITFRP